MTNTFFYDEIKRQVNSRKQDIWVVPQKVVQKQLTSAKREEFDFGLEGQSGSIKVNLEIAELVKKGYSFIIDTQETETQLTLGIVAFVIKKTNPFTDTQAWVAPKSPFHQFLLDNLPKASKKLRLGYHFATDKDMFGGIELSLFTKTFMKEPSMIEEYSKQSAFILGQLVTKVKTKGVKTLQLGEMPVYVEPVLSWLADTENTFSNLYDRYKSKGFHWGYKE